MSRWVTRTALAIGVTASLTLAPLAPGVANAEDRHDQVALMQLQMLLMNDVARQAAAGQSEQGRIANQQLESMPPYAQKEILGIVMAIMKERGAAASEHVDVLNAFGPEAAAMSLSPAIRARIQALGKRLAADEKFKQD